MSVHEFYRLKALISLEQVNTTEVLEKIRILISKTEMVGCCKLLLYANESALMEMTCHVNHFFDLWQ